MQKIINTIAIIFAMLLLSHHLSFAQTTNNRWQLMGISNTDSRLFMERKFEKLAGNRRRTWTKEIFRDGSYKIARAEWQCRTKKYRILEATNYAPEGSSIGREGDTDWQTVVPDSVSENYFRTVCADDRSNEIIDEANSLDAGKTVLVIADKANLRRTPSATGYRLRTLTKDARLILADPEPNGAWYQVIVPDTEQLGWLHGNAIRIIEIAPIEGQSKRQVNPVGKRRAGKY